MAANSVPTAAKPIVPSTSSAASSSGRAKSGAGTETRSAGRAAVRPSPAARPCRAACRRRCAARGAGASSSARSVSPYRSRSNVRPSASVPANAIAIHRMPAAASSDRLALLHEREREDQHARDREEQRRVQNLAALHLDREVLLQHEERGSQKHRSRAVLPTSERRGTGARGPRRAARLVEISRPSRTAPRASPGRRRDRDRAWRARRWRRSPASAPEPVGHGRRPRGRRGR